MTRQLRRSDYITQLQTEPSLDEVPLWASYYDWVEFMLGGCIEVSVKLEVEEDDLGWTIAQVLVFGVDVTHGRTLDFDELATHIRTLTSATILNPALPACLR